MLIPNNFSLTSNEKKSFILIFAYKPQLCNLCGQRDIFSFQMMLHHSTTISFIQ